ncbi:DUF1080 domain-containing protein [soil metagenome]
MKKLAVVFSVLVVALGMFAADEPKPAPKKYKQADMTRPRPVMVTPGTNGSMPSDAISLFDGKDLAAWKRTGKLKEGEEDKPKWTIGDGYFEVAKGTGAIQSRDTFGDVQVHLEWATPKEVKGNGQGRGNSGFFLGGFGEVQILDSIDNDTYPDGQAAALYRRSPPLVNASRQPGEWQTYDIIAHLPKVDDTGKVTKPGIITVLHNGVVVHHAAEFNNKITPYSFQLQDHGNPIRFRNVWVRKLKGYDEGPPVELKKPEKKPEEKKPEEKKPEEKKPAEVKPEEKK